MQQKWILSGLTALTLAAGSFTSLAQYLGPTPYLRAADSPFAQLDFAWFYLETFEDNALNTPGVSASNGTVLGPDQFRDSVDADDGVVNGLGQQGHSFYPGTNSVTFTFSADVPGGLPTHAGVVWTDVGIASPTYGFGRVQLEAFDATNGSLGVFGPFDVGDGLAVGTTPEDRFLGVICTNGISALRVTMSNSSDWELDHLQYGAIATCPTLAIQPGDTNVVLSWTQTNGSNVVLQSSASLGDPTNWVVVDTTPVLVGDRYYVTNSVDSVTRFFRLQCP